MRIMTTVSEVIRLLNEDEEAIEKMLMKLGGKHFTFGVHADILALMGPHFISAIYPSLKDSWDRDLQQSFNDLFTYMIGLMQIGYDEALLQKVTPTWAKYFN